MPSIQLVMDANERVIGVGDDTVEAARQAASATSSASSAAVSAAVAVAASGPNYANTTAGLAATSDGEAFAVDNGDGTVTVYLNDGGSAVEQRDIVTATALGGDAGAEFVGNKVSGTGAILRSQAERNEDIAVAKDFNAEADGSTDDSTAIANAQTQGQSVVLTSGDYVASDLSLPTGCNLLGIGASIKTVADDDRILNADGSQNWRVDGIDFIGRRTTAVADPSAETEVAIGIRDAHRAVLSNLSFTDFKRAGIYRDAGSFTDSGSGRGTRVLGVGLGFYECTTGILTNANSGSEYDVYSVFHAGGCDYGADLTAGNTILTAFHLADNRLANLRLRGGVNNHLHNVIGDGTINHCDSSGFLLHATDITNGVSISNVAAYANATGGNGPLFLQDCGGVCWNAGIIDAWTYIRMDGFDDDTYYPYNKQEGAFLPGSYGPARIFESDGVSDEDYSPFLIRKNCHGPGLLDQNGITTNDPADLFVWMTQATASLFAQGDILKFATDNALSDRRQCYSSATGLVTIPKWMDGLYEYEAVFAISGTLATPDASYLEVVVNPVGGGAQQIVSPPIMPDPYDDGTSLWTVKTGKITVHLSAGDAIGIKATTIGGSARYLGHASWPNSGFTLKKIA